MSDELIQCSFCAGTATCRACAGPLRPENCRIADGCPCNSPRGVNHGIVPKDTCTCDECDPATTGSTRYPALPEVWPAAKAQGAAEATAAIVKRIRELVKMSKALERFGPGQRQVTMALSGLALEIEAGDHITKESNDE